MNYLSNYTDEKMTALFNRTGTFFAFSNKQFDEAKTDDVKYTSCGAGMICPTDNVDTLMTGLETIHSAGIAADMAENGAKAIIHRELANHEAQICGSIESTLDALAGYPITREDVQAQWVEFYDHCVDNDYF